MPANALAGREQAGGAVAASVLWVGVKLTRIHMVS